MKRTVMVAVILLMLFYLGSCDVDNYEDEIDLIASGIEQNLPMYFNSDYHLPDIADYEVSWRFDGVDYQDTYIYDSPMVDKDMDIEISISRGQTQKVFNYTRKRLSLTLANYKTEMHISMNEDVSDINRDDYFDMSAFVTSELNGYEQYALTEQEGRIRGRGNSTWDTYPKKPYKIKFDERVSILGMPECKTYVLLAEYADPSMMRNTITHQLSKFFDFEHTLETRYVDLYINDDYQGVYVLTEQVEEDKNKLNLDLDIDLDNLSFLIELDMRYVDDPTPDEDAWLHVENTHYEVKDLDPDEDEYTTDYRDAIASYLQLTYDRIISQDGYNELADMNEWIDYFLVQEISKNVDGWFSSVYLYKDKDNLLSFGPLWDFDLAFGNANYIDYGYQGFYDLRPDKNIWFHEMMKIEEIRTLFKQRYIAFYNEHKDEYLNMITALYESLEDDFERNETKWQRLGLNMWPNPSEIVNAENFHAQYEYLYRYVENRLDWLYTAVNSQAYANAAFDQA